MQQLLPSLAEWPVVFAHRGARAHAPENTLDAFTLGLRLGANGLESDAWLTSEGEVVLDHDGVVRRGLRKIRFGEVERASLPSHIPTLAEMFATCGTNFHLSLDVKDPGATETIIAESDSAGFPRGQLWLCHPEPDVVFRWRSHYPDVRIVLSTTLKKMTESPESLMARLSSQRIDALNMPQSDWTGGLVALAHRFELLAFAWDVQQIYRAEEILRMGIDGVYGDHVDVLVDSYRRHTGSVPPPPL